MILLKNDEVIDMTAHWFFSIQNVEAKKLFNF